MSSSSSSSSSSSASTQPKIRGACENCHRRKIRCIIAPGDSACVNCVHSGSACLFAPRSKPGRPRRVTSDKPSTQGPEPHDIQSSSSSNPQRSSPEYDPHSIEHDLMQVADLDALDVEAAWNICWSTPDEAISLPDPNAFAYSMLPHSLPKTWAWPRANMASMPAYPLSPPASLGPSPSNESMDLEELSFDMALQVCKKLDEYCQYIAHPVFMPSVDHEVFGVMARICTLAASKAPAASHCPAAALILAAILKVLELCGLIVAKLSRQPPASPLGGSMESMFLLKKIDLLLLQTKVFLSQIEHHAGVQKAVELHRHIEHTVQNDYPAMAW